MGIEDIVSKAKAALPDDATIDDLAAKAKGLAPEKADSVIDTVAEQAKQHND